MVDVAAILRAARLEISDDDRLFGRMRYMDPNVPNMILNMPTVRNVIAKAVSELTKLGFEIVNGVYYFDDEIRIIYKTQFDNNWTAFIYITNTSVTIRFSNGSCRCDYENYVANAANKVRTACIIQEMRKVYTAAIFAALPQPIAEEIAAEFSLY